MFKTKLALQQRADLFLSYIVAKRAYIGAKRV